MIFDCHSDILYDLVHHPAELRVSRWSEFHLPRLTMGSVGGVVAAYYSTPSQKKFPFEQICETLSAFQTNPTLKLILKNDDLIPSSNKVSVLWALEGLVHCKTVEPVIALVEKGVRMVSLTWNESNQWGTGSLGDASRGITPLGVELLQELSRRQVILDISHLNEKTALDIMSIWPRSLVASHSNANSIFPHRRNLTDEVIRKLASKGGIVCVNAYPPFLETRATLQSMADHLRYLIQLVGIDHVGLGFDFMDYLDSTVKEPTLPFFSSIKETKNLYDLFVKNDFTLFEIEQLTWRNMSRIIKESL